MNDPLELDDVSQATLRNWKKLRVQPSERLTARANKRRSQKRVLPLEYFRNKKNAAFVRRILDFLDDAKTPIGAALLSLGVNLLKRARLDDKPHVANVLKEYSHLPLLPPLVAADVPRDEFDILGLLYQASLQEGAKNRAGSYYTPERIVKNMTSGIDLSRGATFFDPCCGSGAFLLAVDADDPRSLYGIDVDPIAVMLAKINLLLKYPTFEFAPRLFCVDYLRDESPAESPLPPIFGQKFDYIASNPPWGAARASKETFSSFFMKAFGQLAPTGSIRFLFPESILNVKLHKEIRQFILRAAKLRQITLYDERFSGVATKYVDIECAVEGDRDVFLLTKGGRRRAVAFQNVYETENLTFNFLSDEDAAILGIVKERGKYSLKGSEWALGIVTGDNKTKLKSAPGKGLEKIYTGKEIEAYCLKPATKYLRYDRNALQQAAPDAMYRAAEKLVYKFISNRLVFAYDASGSLFLNSANILVPAIPTMSAKTVMAFLNSALFQFVYVKLFGEVKTLKGNLCELPFPELTREQDAHFTALADEILRGAKGKRALVDAAIFSLYGLSKEQIANIERALDKKFEAL